MKPITLSLSFSEPGSDIDFIVAKVEDPWLLEAALRSAIGAARAEERRVPSQVVKRVFLERALNSIQEKVKC